MTRDEKIQFIRELMDNMTKTVLSKVDRMPEEWDGHELRAYIADYAQQDAAVCFSRGEDRRRKRAYKNEVLVRNL